MELYWRPILEYEFLKLSPSLKESCVALRQKMKNTQENEKKKNKMRKESSWADGATQQQQKKNDLDQCTYIYAPKGARKNIRLNRNTHKWKTTTEKRLCFC